MLIPQKPCVSHTPHCPGGAGFAGNKFMWWICDKNSVSERVEANHARRSFFSMLSPVAPSAAGTQRTPCFWNPSPFFWHASLPLQRNTRGSATRPCMWGKGNDVPGRNCLRTEVSSKATEGAEVLTGAGTDAELLQGCVYRGADGCHPRTGRAGEIQLHQSLVLSQLSKPNWICSKRGHFRSWEKKLVSGLVLGSIQGDGSWDVTATAGSTKDMGGSSSKSLSRHLTQHKTFKSSFTEVTGRRRLSLPSKVSCSLWFSCCIHCQGD